jgi:hypothetical protein
MGELNQQPQQLHPDDLLLIPASLLQAVINYMAERPWKEVGNAMPQLMALKPATKESE